MNSTITPHGSNGAVNAPPAPDPAWNDLARLFEDAQARGQAAELDPGAIARARALLDGIEARGAKTWEILDGGTISMPLPPRSYPISGFAMAPGPPALWLSFSFGGKSVILQDMLLSLATGTRIWGRWACEPCDVIHVDYEQGREETIERYQRLARGRSPMIDIERDAGSRLALAVMPPAYLNSAGAEEAYKRALDGKRLAFLDTFAAALPGVEENETTIGEHVYRLGRVSAATGATICVAHHMGKAALQAGGKSGKPADPRTLARGSTAIFAAAGYVYALGGGKGEPKLVQQVKARGLGDPQVEDFYLELGPVDVREPDPMTGWGGYFNRANPADVGGFEVKFRTVEQVKPPKTAKEESFEADVEAVLGYVREQNAKGRGVATMSEPHKALKMRKASCLDAFKALVVRKVVSGRGRNGTSDYWILNPLPGVSA